MRDGGTPDSPLIGRYCRTIPPSFVSQSNQLFIRFRSDWSIGNSGFRATYESRMKFNQLEWFTNRTVICFKRCNWIECGGIWGDPSGLIQSPNFPNPYPGSKQCVYVVGLDPGKVIQLDFPVFDVEGSHGCIFDYIEVNFTFIRLSCSRISGLMCSVFLRRYVTGTMVTRRLSADIAEVLIEPRRWSSAPTTTSGLSS